VTTLGALATLAVLALVVGVVAVLRVQWRSRTSQLVDRVNASRRVPQSTYSAASDLDGLPPVVQRYFRTVLRDGQPLIRRARLEQQGEFLMKAEQGTWVPFVATQHVGVEPPAFVWDARMRVARVLSVRVRDAFAGGQGCMHASLLGLVPLVAVEGTPGIARGALFRYLAEAPCYPTALLPRAGVCWTALDDASARATVTVDGFTVSLDVHFGGDGLIERVYASDRPRHLGGQDVATPWEGRWLEYREHDDMRVPVRGTVAWLLPDGPQVYWQGRVTTVVFE